MGRGVVAACLAIMLCHGLSFGQTPPIGGMGIEPPPVAPLAPEAVPAPIAHDGAPDVGHPAGAAAGGFRVWAGAEYLLWWVRTPRLPVPLVTSGLLTNDPGGVLNESGTQVLLGSQSHLNDDPYSGIRLRAGFDLGDSGLGFEAIGFALNQQRTRFTFPSSTVNPDIISIPVFNADLGTEAVLRVRDPDRVEGSVNVSIRTNLAGAEGNLGYAVNSCVVDWAYVGYRYLNLTESLALNTTFQALAPGFLPFLGTFQPAGTVGQISESFGTSNEFNGGQFGLVKRVAYRNVSLDLRTSVALGETRQRVRIQGESTVTPPGGAAMTAPGGIFSQVSNIGTYTTNQFSVVPEVGATLYVRMLDCLIGSVGYNFLYWTNVVRPGEQIDRNIELQQTPFSGTFTGIPGGRPTVTNRRSDLTVHGLSAGLAISF